MKPLLALGMIFGLAAGMAHSVAAEQRAPVSGSVVPAASPGKASPGVASHGAGTHDEAAHVVGADPHAALPRSPALSLASVLEAMLAIHFEQPLIAAEADHGRAWQAHGHSLVNGPLTLSQRYQSDRMQGDDGLTEIETGVAVPLWHRGERANARELGAAIAEVANAAQRELRWRLAGDLRTLLWSLESALRRVELATATLADNERLEAALAREVDLGGRPRALLALARIEVIDARRDLLQAQADLVDLQVEYRVTTGLDALPATLEESLATTEQVPHPFIALAETRLQQSEHEAAAQRYRARGTPTLTIGPRWERGNRAEQTDESFGATLTVPISGARTRQLALTTAALGVAAAQSELDARRRAHHLALHEAGHQLGVARELAADTAAIADLATRSAALMEKAFAAGEIEFTELLRARRMARERELAAELARLNEHQAIAMQNQAMGVTP